MIVYKKKEGEGSMINLSFNL